MKWMLAIVGLVVWMLYTGDAFTWCINCINTLADLQQ